MTKKRCHKKSKKGGGRNSGSARMGTVSWQRWRWGCHKRGGKKGVAKKRWQKRGDKKEVAQKRWQEWVAGKECDACAVRSGQICDAI